MNKAEVLKLANLARIEMSDDEADKLSGEFEAILKYVGEVESLKVSPSGLNSQGETLRNVMREGDEPHESGIYTERLLSEAPEREGDYIKVKKIL